MKTIKEINDIAPFHPNEWQQGYGIWQWGFREGQDYGATEQKAIDIDEIPKLYVRWLMIDGDKPSWKEYANKAMEETK